MRNRLLAPDLARGAMLALIALANSTVYLYARPYGVRQHIVEDGMLDRIVSVLMVTLVDARAYPMFAALFAYGAVQILARGDRPVLRRRSGWLIVFGLAHAVLLFPGDILGLYGVVGFVLLALTRVSDRNLLVAAAVWLIVVVLLPWTFGLGAVLSTAQTAALAVGTWLVSVLIADRMGRSGTRGPAEVLLRRLTYQDQQPVAVRGTSS